MGYAQKIVVIGAGISGLACAYRLKQLGLRPLVLEAADGAGGVIATIRRNGFLFETGPQFPRFPASVWRLVHELGLKDEFVAGDPKAKRYVFRHGRLHPAPFSPAGVLTTKLVGLKSKLRVLSEPLSYTQPPGDEETLADFVERKFGAEILENLVDPLISTIFLGDAHKMGMESAFPALVEWERSRGSLVRGALRARKSKRNASRDSASQPASTSNTNRSNTLQVTDALPTLGSFKSGMGTLPEKLAEALRAEITYKSPVSSVVPLQKDDSTSGAAWQICLADGQQISAEHAVLTVPAHFAASLLQTSVPQLACHLGAIEYAPVCVVSSAYDRSKVENKLDGFGFMVPRREGLRAICTFWNSSLFAGRAPEGAVLLTSFAAGEVGGEVGEISEVKYGAAVAAENARILGISGEPLDRVVWRNPKALPQYNVGHARRVTEISAILRTLPGLHLAGNFLSGRSIGDCVDVAFRVAEDVHSQLRRQNI